MKPMNRIGLPERSPSGLLWIALAKRVYCRRWIWTVLRFIPGLGLTGEAVVLLELQKKFAACDA